MSDEPRNHPVFMITLGLVSLATAPFPFLLWPDATLFGLPAWLLWSLGLTATLSVVTAWGTLRYWKDDP